MSRRPPRTAAGRYLVVDGGRTASRAALYEGSRRIDERSGAALPYAVDGSIEPALHAITRLIEPVFARSPGFDAVVLGLAAIDSQTLAAQVAEHIGTLVRSREVVVAVDAVTQSAGALGGGCGAVMAAGTGAIALAVAEDGSSRRSDGWGYLLGDDGSGFAIGRRGLASALRWLDGRGGSAALARLATERYGSLEQLQHRVYSSPHPVQEVAAFAPDVAVAARAGDATAAAIWTDAANELATTTVAAMAGVFPVGAPVPVSWAGGLFQATDLLLPPFVDEILARWPAAEVRAPAGDALEGAWIIAASASGTPFEPLLYRFAAAAGDR